MKTTMILAFAVLVLSATLYAQTAERMRPGQWSTSTIVGGKTYAASQCISKPDADEMNGDVKKVEAYLRKTIPPEACQVTDVKVNGLQVNRGGIASEANQARLRADGLRKTKRSSSTARRVAMPELRLANESAVPSSRLAQSVRSG